MVDTANKQKVQILHYDDEIPTVDWIPDALIEAFFLKYPGRVEVEHGDEDENEDEVIARFSYRDAKQIHADIEYRIIADESRFLDILEHQDKCFSSRRIVLIDVVREGDDGTPVANGLDIYKKIEEMCPTLNKRFQFFITAFPKQIYETLSTDAPAREQVLKKPLNGVRVGELLMERIGDLIDGATS